MRYRQAGFNYIRPNQTKQFFLDKFLGVDFTSGDYISDYRRSPDALNLIWGSNPYLPETRAGYKRILSSILSDTEMYGIHINTNKDVILVHAGSNLYQLAGSMDSYTSSVVYTGLEEQTTTSFMMNGKLYIVGGGALLEHDTTVSLVTDNAFVPTTVIGRSYNGGGTVLEAVNLLSIKRKNSFVIESVPETITDTFTGDNTTVEFTLTETAITATNFTVTLNDIEKELYTDYTVDRVEKTVTFVTAPATDVAIEIVYEINTGDNYPTEYQLDSTYIDYIPITVTSNGTELDEESSVTDTLAGDGATVEFDLTTDYSITSTPFVVKIDDVTTTDYTADRTAKTVTFTEAPENEAVITVTYGITQYFSVDREAGTVTFITAPEPLEGLEGVDSIVIEFSKSSGTEEEIEQIDSTTADGSKTVWDIDCDYPITADDMVVKLNATEQDETTDYTINRILKTITFNEAPESGNAVSITYTYIEDTRADYINNCTIFGIFGGKNDTRVFLTGNSDYKNRDWHSGLYDPTYFPDTGYTDVGEDTTAIMGYVKQYDTQMVIKEGNQQDGSAFLRRFAIDDNDVAYFPLEQGSVGIGAISTKCFNYIQGEPLFMSSQGVVGVAGTNVDNQRLIQDKSTLVNSKLTNESNLENAFAVEYKNRYYLFVNNKVYVADARMRYTDSLGNVQYEWQYWNNVYADCAVVYGEYLIFGYGGMLFRFKLSNESALYIDEDYNGSESSIQSYWTTPKLYFGSISKKKTLDYIYVILGKQNKLKVNIDCVIDNDYSIDLGTFTKTSVFYWYDVDFSDYTFLSENKTYTEKSRANIKRFDNIKFKFSSVIEDNTNAGLGLELIQANYSFLDD